MFTDLPAHGPKYANFDGTAVDLIIDHPDLGTLPFTASAHDTEALGQSLHARAMNGDFGPIAPYDGPSPGQVLAGQMRQQRNQKLAALDAIVMHPLRWAEFTEPQQVALASYRQALLDVPQQAGFPANIEWPEPPGFLVPTAPQV